MLEGSAAPSVAGGAVLTPRLEAGLRYDGGDAETGAVLAYALGRIAVQVDARGLLAHWDAAYGEWGYSASVSYRAEADGRGLSLQLDSVSDQAQGGLQSLWSQPDVANPAGRGGALAGAQRLNTQIGYGFSGRKPERHWHPYLSAEATAEAGQALTLGLKLTSGAHAQAGLEIGRRHSGDSGALDVPEQAIRLTGSIRW